MVMMLVTFAVVTNGDSRSEPLRVSGEEGGLTDVMKPTKELDNSFETEACSSMRGSTILKRVDIILELCDRDTIGLSSLRQHRCIVYTLRTTGNFFASHEEVI